MTQLQSAARALVEPFVIWLRAEASAGRVLPINHDAAPALVLQRRCVGLWFSLHPLGEAEPKLSDVLHDPAPRAMRERGHVWLLPEALCAFVAAHCCCEAAAVVPTAVALLCDLVRSRRAHRPLDPAGGGWMLGEPSADTWHWQFWIRRFRMADGTVAPVIELPCSAFLPV